MGLNPMERKLKKTLLLQFKSYRNQRGKSRYFLLSLRDFLQKQTWQEGNKYWGFSVFVLFSPDKAIKSSLYRSRSSRFYMIFCIVVINYE